jgi:WD40 repeat protein
MVDMRSWLPLRNPRSSCVPRLSGVSQDVKLVAWHPAGEQLVSCSYDDTIKCWASDGDEWVCSQTLAGESPASGAVGR